MLVEILESRESYFDEIAILRSWKSRLKRLPPKEWKDLIKTLESIG